MPDEYPDDDPRKAAYRRNLDLGLYHTANPVKASGEKTAALAREIHRKLV